MRGFAASAALRLPSACAGCGAANEPGRKFCYQCGAALEGPVTAAGVSASRAEPAAERRLVSVLFADLVGFTTLSESRDAEEVRELLSQYFETARTLIERYGGTVEKFIGDAVMAAWGVPVATEDDAERAVRAALDLVTAVEALGLEVGARDLAARVGVLTGEAAVTLGAEGQGMVAGDIVNTASRVQSAAEPGHRPRRRCNTPRKRGRGRIPEQPERTSSRVRPSRSSSGERSASSPVGRALSGRSVSRRRSSGASVSSVWSRTSSTRRRTSTRRISCL